MKNSGSPEATKLNKEFTILIKVLGGYTQWSTAERQRTLGKLYAMSNFMGPPSFFFTIAPCIADSEICLKLLNFPTFRYKIKQSTNEQRSVWSAKNPVASAKAFHIIMNALVSTFICIPTGNTKYSVPVDCLEEQENDDVDYSLSSRFEAHLKRRSGCLGVPTAFYGIYEAQGRGALHMHALIWTLLNTELLNRCTKDELQKICVLIDQFIATWISDEDATTEECAKKSESFVRCALRYLPRNLSLAELRKFGK